jgi:hypothetical protein
MNPILAPVIGGIVESVGKLADDLFTSDKERLDAELELRKLGIEELKIDAGLAQGQIDVNKIEAAGDDKFTKRWRPALGWVGVLAMAYQFVVYPFLTWGWALMQAKGWVPDTLPAPPMLDTDALWVILTGILGLGTARTVEKLRDKAGR